MLLEQGCGRGAQPVTNVVSIQQHRGATKLAQLSIQLIRHGALTATAEPGEPDNDAFLTQPALSLAASHGLFMPYDIRLIGHREKCSLIQGARAMAN